MLKSAFCAFAVVAISLAILQTNSTAPAIDTLPLPSSSCPGGVCPVPAKVEPVREVVAAVAQPVATVVRSVPVVVSAPVAVTRRVVVQPVRTFVRVQPVRNFVRSQPVRSFLRRLCCR